MIDKNRRTRIPNWLLNKDKNKQITIIHIAASSSLGTINLLVGSKVIGFTCSH